MTPEQKPDTEARTPEQIAAEMLDIVPADGMWVTMRPLLAQAISAALAAKDERIAKLESHIRDMHFTYQFGAEVMNKLVIPRADKMLDGEIAINALNRWMFERDQLRDKHEIHIRALAAKDAEIARLTKWPDDLRSCGEISCDECNERTAAMRAEIERLKRHLSNLLARIHRDGGHYEQSVGTDRAVQDAHVRVAQLNSDNDQLEAKDAEIQRLKESLRDLSNVGGHIAGQLKSQTELLRELAQALKSIHHWFGSPKREEWLNDDAFWEAKKVNDNAAEILSKPAVVALLASGQRSDHDRLQVIERLLIENDRLRKERDKWKTEAQEMEGRIANALL